MNLQIAEPLQLRFIPVSIVFNGDRNNGYRYNLVAENGGTNPEYNYINGRNTSAHEFTLGAWSGSKEFNHDWDTRVDGTVATVGYGIYKIVVNWNGSPSGFDTCTIEWDAGYPIVDPLSADLGIFFKDDGENPRLEYRWGSGTQQTLPTDRKLYAWIQPGLGSRSKQYGNFIYDNVNNNNYTVLPQDFRQDCGDENYPSFAGQYGTGRLTQNLTIDKNIQTRVTSVNGERFETPTQIVITPNCTLKVNGGKTFTVKYDSYYVYDNTYYNKVIVQPNSWLYLNSSNANITFENTNWLILESQSHVKIGSGSSISMLDRSHFCNKGAVVEGPGTINIQRRVWRCVDPTQTNIFEDSLNIILKDTADWEIPDSTIMEFRGNKTLLSCDSGSTIRFGKGPKITFKDGARLKAKYTKFVCIDSTQTWDGIYLSGISYDTLKNCIVENAYNGINIEDKISLYDPVATEISGCTFKNTTTTDLLNYVYVNNSTNVLIKNCNSAVTSLGKFTSGIIAEYCPSNGVIIADNNINNVTTGLNIVQSSLYIGRNTITGSTNSGTGIYLDNSNGTIEYNIVNNFQKSILAYYSSPYLLKNTFSGASSKNIDLTSNSSPVMKPVVSGSTLRWLGGNNSITGTPSVCGISFTDCYPLLDSGYNRVIVNGADYLNGVFTFQYTTVLARLNWWYDEPPQSSLFDITGGDVTYSPTFDGSSVPATDGSELNSLGWGLYDTVYTKSLGDNPTPEDIFMQAYTKEMHSEYAEAINLYKQVVSEYKSSSYAPVSLARIFNCLEKNNSSPPVYQAIQGYYTNIHGDTTYPHESRELSEDFSIKSKVRQGLIENAIIDYDNIYSHNQNNSKGHHALINKLCLLNMSQGGDNPYGENNSNVKHKYDLLSLIIGKNIEPKTSIVIQNIPKQFKLYQNYPNPFNPVTTIKYDIPAVGTRHGVFVQIKIYDITGREVFSINEYKRAGNYSVTFDGTNYSSGIYFYILETNNYTESKKMILMK